MVLAVYRRTAALSCPFVFHLRCPTAPPGLCIVRCNRPYCRIVDQQQSRATVGRCYGTFPWKIEAASWSICSGYLVFGRFCCSCNFYSGRSHSGRAAGITLRRWFAYHIFFAVPFAIRYAVLTSSYACCQHNYCWLTLDKLRPKSATFDIFTRKKWHCGQPIMIPISSSIVFRMSRCLTFCNNSSKKRKQGRSLVKKYNLLCKFRN